VRVDGPYRSRLTRLFLSLSVLFLVPSSPRPRDDEVMSEGRGGRSTLSRAYKTLALLPRLSLSRLYSFPHHRRSRSLISLPSLIPVPLQLAAWCPPLPDPDRISSQLEPVSSPLPTYFYLLLPTFLSPNSHPQTHIPKLTSPNSHPQTHFPKLPPPKLPFPNSSTMPLLSALNLGSLLSALGLVSSLVKPVPIVGDVSSGLLGAVGKGANSAFGGLSAPSRPPILASVDDGSISDGSESSATPAPSSAAPVCIPITSYENSSVPLQGFAPFDQSLANVFRYRQQQSVNLGSW
jgi:hypothetical protein